MRAIVIEKPGAFQIKEIPIPKPESDELLIQVKAVSLCNQHDWKVNNGLYQDLAYLEYGVPGFPGHEGAGIVVQTGDAVTDFQVGDHVAMSGLGGPPLYAEYVTRKADSVARVGADVPLEQVAMAELFGCVHRACQKISDYKGKTVTVSGCGPAGLAGIQICKAYAAEKVIAIDVRADRLEVAAKLGADQIVDANDKEQIKDLKDQGSDIVLECTGNKIAYTNAFYIARKAVVIFSYIEGTLEIPFYPLFDRELTIYNSKWLTTDDLQKVVNLIESGKVRTDELISIKAGFEKYQDLVRMVGRGEVIKAIMIP